MRTLTLIMCPLTSTWHIIGKERYFNSLCHSHSRVAVLAVHRVVEASVAAFRCTTGKLEHVSYYYSMKLRNISALDLTIQTIMNIRVQTSICTLPLCFGSAMSKIIFAPRGFLAIRVQFITPVSMVSFKTQNPGLHFLNETHNKAQ